MKSVKHNKIKNTGILFELLTRQITNDVMEGKTTSAAEYIMQKHFSPKTELGKELMLYRSFFNVNNLSEQKAFKFITLLLQQRNKLNEETLRSQKYHLIKDLKESYDLKMFFNTRIPSYKIYASIYKLFETAHDTVHIEDVECVAGAQFTLVEHLMGKVDSEVVARENAIMEVMREKDESVRVRSFTILLEKFNEKYAELSTKQKNLLREYINNISTSGKFAKYINEEAKILYNEIQTVLGKVENTVTQIKLREVLSQLDKVSTITIVKENHITAMLVAYEICQELSKLSDSHAK